LSQDLVRRLAPLGYGVGAIVLLDQVLYVVASAGSFAPGLAGWPFYVAGLVVGRLSAVMLALALTGFAAVALDHRAFGRVWLVVVGLVLVAAVGAAGVGLGFDAAAEPNVAGLDPGAIKARIVAVAGTGTIALGVLAARVWRAVR
jgi:hypothetical protein